MRRCPLSHAPQTLGKLPFGRCLIDLPGPIEYPVPQLTGAVFLHLQDRVEKTQHQRDLGTQPAPRLARCFPAIGADRARLIRGPQGLGFLGKLAIAPLQGLRIGGLDHAHAQDTAAANSRRDGDLLPCHPVSFSAATRARGTCCGSLTVVPTSDGRPQASQARYQNMASRPKT